MRANGIKIQSRVYRSLLASYLVVLLIPVSLFLLGSRFYLGAMNAQIDSANRAALSTLARSVDTQIDILYSSSSRLLVDTRTLRLMRQEKVAVQQDYDDLSELRSQIVNNVLHSAYIADICLYFPQSDIWLCKDGILRGMDSFQYYLVKNLPIGMEDWEAGLHFNGRKNERLVEANGQQLLLYHKYTNTRAEDALTDVIAVIRVDTEALRGLLAAFNDNGTAVFRILVADGGMILADSTALEPAAVVDSAGTQLHYALYPMTHIATFTRLMRIAAVFIVLSLTASIALIIVFSRRHYSPIQRLTGTLLTQMQKDPTPIEDEYQVLEREISGLLQQMHRTENIAVEYETMRNDRLLRDLMAGENDAAPDALDVLGFQSDRFIVVLHSAGQQNVADTNGDDEDESLNVIELIVKTVARYQTDPDEKRYVFAMDGMIVCLINLAEREDADPVAHVKADALNSAEYLRTRFSVTSNIVISSVVCGAEHLQEAFEHVRELMDYQLLTGDDDLSVVCADEAAGHLSAGGRTTGSIYADIHLPIQQLQSRSYDRARDTFSSILEDSAIRRVNGDPRPLRLHLHSLTELLVLALQDMDDVDDDLARTRDALLEELYSCESVSSLRLCADSAFSMLERHHAQRMHSTDRDRRILQYVTEHYQDPEFNVNALSQQFDLSASYISMLIRRQTGLSAVDYIHSLRIDRAKRLLRERPAMLIKDIAQEVGYGSSLNLIRAFRRYEGTTPTKYREIVS